MFHIRELNISWTPKLLSIPTTAGRWSPPSLVIQQSTHPSASYNRRKTNIQLISTVILWYYDLKTTFQKISQRILQQTKNIQLISTNHPVQQTKNIPAKINKRKAKIFYIPPKNKLAKNIIRQTYSSMNYPNYSNFSRTNLQRNELWRKGFLSVLQRVFFVFLILG